MQSRPISSAAIATNKKISLLVGLVDFVDITAIFSMFFRTFLHAFLESIGKFIFFPIAAGANLIQAVLAWRQAYLDGGQAHSVVRALVETGVALAITTAVVGTLAFTALFATISPIIFASALGAKTFYHAVSAIYFLGKFAATNDAIKREEYRELAINNTASAGATLLATAGVVAVFIFGKFALAGLGVAAGIVGAGFILYKGIRMYTDSQSSAPTIIVAASDVGPKKRSQSSPELLLRAFNITTLTSKNTDQQPLLNEQSDVLIPAGVTTNLSPSSNVDNVQDKQQKTFTR